MNPETTQESPPSNYVTWLMVGIFVLLFGGLGFSAWAGSREDPEKAAESLRLHKEVVQAKNEADAARAEEQHINAMEESRERHCRAILDSALEYLALERDIATKAYDREGKVYGYGGKLEAEYERKMEKNREKVDKAHEEYRRCLIIE